MDSMQKNRMKLENMRCSFIYQNNVRQINVEKNLCKAFRPFEGLHQANVMFLVMELYLLGGEDRKTIP